MVETSTQAPPYRTANIHFVATVPHALQLNGKRSLRLYEEPDEIVIKVAIIHDSPVAASGDQGAFAQKLRVAVRGPNDGLLNVLVTAFFERGTSSVRLARDEPLIFLARSDLPASIASGLNWSIQLRRADGGRFTAGHYVVDVSLAGAAETLQMADGSFSRAANSDVSFAIELGLPQTDEERVRMYVSLANEAMRARQYDDVVTNALRALNLRPSDAGAALVLDGALMRSNRCREAAATLEKGHPWTLQQPEPFQSLLALSYLCTGDETNARRVLRLGGYRDGRLDDAISRLKADRHPPIQIVR